MAYTPTSWTPGVFGTEITSARLNNIETGIGNSVVKDALTFNVKDYGATGASDDATRDTAAINAALAARTAAGGGEIFFPPLPAGRNYRYNGSLPITSGISYRGVDRDATSLIIHGADAFAVGSAQSSQRVTISGLYIQVIDGHFLSVAANGSCNYWRVSNCTIVTYTNGKSWVRARGTGDYLENYWEHLDLYRPTGATVPGFDIINSFGGANANVWKRIRVNSNNCTSTPAWRIESDASGAYAYDNSWEDIVGEQNAGGLIHLYSAQGAHIRNVFDHDASVNYAADLIRVTKSATTGTVSRCIMIQNVGRRGGTLAGGVYDCYIAPDQLSVWVWNAGNHGSTPVVALSDYAGLMTSDWGIQLAAGDSIRLGRLPTAQRPSASSAGSGAMVYDTTLSKPIWSNGTVWKDATGTTV